MLENRSSEQDTLDVVQDLSLATSFAVEFVKGEHIPVISGPYTEVCTHVLSEPLHSH